jgi:hypothetical protein
MYKKYEILKLLVSFCRFVNLQIVRTKTFIRKRRHISDTKYILQIGQIACIPCIYPAISTFAVQIYHTNKFLLYS